MPEHGLSCLPIYKWVGPRALPVFGTATNTGHNIIDLLFRDGINLPIDLPRTTPPDAVLE